MSTSVVCASCGIRLKLPREFARKKAKCPRCNARVDVAAALNASAYLPTLTNPLHLPGAKPATSPIHLPSEREEDPLPYQSLNPISPPPVPPPPQRITSAASAPLSLSADDAPLSLDDEPALSQSPPAPSGPPPFRVPVRMTADSANLFLGPCEAVFVAHGLFLECIPFRPFLYAPVGTNVDCTTSCRVDVVLADKRHVAWEFSGPSAGQLATDTAAFLAGQRGVPVASEYRSHPRWLIALALVLALAPAVSPIALSRTANLGLATGLKLGLFCALFGLLANGATVLLSRRSIPGKIAVMGLVGLLVSSFFLTGAAGYLAGRRDAVQAQEKPAPSPEGATPTEPGPASIGAPEQRSLNALEVAERDGLYRFEDGPDDVMALAVGADSSVLGIGYKNGTSRIWRLERSTVDPTDFDPGPASDGPPSAMHFDRGGKLLYTTCSGGITVAFWNNAPATPIEIPGDMVAVFDDASGDRFLAARGRMLVVRTLPADLIKNPAMVSRKGTPAAKGKDFVVTAATDEKPVPEWKGPFTLPAGRLTFLGWHPAGKLLGGLADGSIVAWGASGTSTVLTREHKGAVRAWAVSPAHTDLATGDDKGMIGLWANKAIAPKTFIASATAAITHLSFSPSGSRLMARDAEGTISVWDLSIPRALVKARRPACQAIAYGPRDDLVFIGNGKAIELWTIKELDRRP